MRYPRLQKILAASLMLLAPGTLCLFAGCLGPCAQAQNADINKLLKELKSKKYEVRENAADRLGETQDSRAVGPLIQALNDQAPYVVASAALALGRFRAQSAVDPLLAVLNDPKIATTQIAAITALGEIGDPRAIATLLQVPKSSFTRGSYPRLAASLFNDMKTALVAALANFGAQAVDPLVAALNDSDEEVRWCAATALGSIKDPRAVPPLIAALKDADFFMMPALITALGDIGDSRAAGPLLQAAKNTTMSDAKWALSNALVKLGAPAIDALAAALNDPDPGVRLYAVTALAGIKDPHAVPPLIAALKDADNDVKKAAATGLEAAGPAAFEPVTAALNAPDPAVRSVLLILLNVFKDPRAVPYFITALHDADAQVRLAAVLGLGSWIKDPRAEESLISCLKDQDARVRAAAAIYLGYNPDSRAIQPLFDTLYDPDAHVRQAAEAALQRYPADTLRSIGAPAIAALVAALSRPDCALRVFASGALSRIGGPAIDALLSALKESDPDLHSLAFAALDKIDDPRVTEALKSSPEIEARNSIHSAFQGSQVILTLFRKTGDEYTFFALAELNGELELVSEGIIGGVDSFHNLQFAEPKDKWFKISNSLLVNGQGVVTIEDGRTFRIFNLGGNFTGQIEPLQSEPASGTCFPR